jgi:hypothetical protein
MRKAPLSTQGVYTGTTKTSLQKETQTNPQGPYWIRILCG